MKKYKVLDIREVHTCTKGSLLRVTITMDKKIGIIVIAEDMDTKKRERFHFYKGEERNNLYMGYKGDFDILIRGDIFTIEPPAVHDYPNVVILTPAS